MESKKNPTLFVSLNFLQRKIQIEITDFENNISDKTPEFYYHGNYFLFDRGIYFSFHSIHLFIRTNICFK